MRLGILKPETDDFLTMDALRFLAATGIVVYHYRVSILTPAIFEIFQTSFARVYQFVDLFFILSGFIIAAVYSSRLGTRRDFASFMIKRLARLWPLHLLLLCLYLGIWWASITLGQPLNDPTKYVAACVIPNIFMVHSIPICADNLTFNYVSWSISAEMFMYLLAPGILIFSRRPLILIICAALAFLGFSLIPADRPWTDWTYDWGVARALPAFAVGMSLFRLRRRLGVPFPHILMMGALLVFFALSWTDAPMWVSLLVIYFVAISAAAADAKRDVPRWVKHVSRLSPLTYGIYMWHPIMFTIGYSFIGKKMFGLSGIASDGFLLVVALTVGLVAYFSLFLFEMPLRWQVARLSLRLAPIIPGKLNADG